MRPIVIIPLLFLLAYLYPYIPGHDLSWCAIKIGTGFNCPGCGIVRSVSALVHGNFSKSFHFHPLGFVVAGWLVYAWVRAIFFKIKKRV